MHHLFNLSFKFRIFLFPDNLVIIINLQSCLIYTQLWQCPINYNNKHIYTYIVSGPYTHHPHDGCWSVIHRHITWTHTHSLIHTYIYLLYKYIIIVYNLSSSVTGRKRFFCVSHCHRRVLYIYTYHASNIITPRLALLTVLSVFNYKMAVGTHYIINVQQQLQTSTNRNNRNSIYTARAAMYITVIYGWYIV